MLRMLMRVTESIVSMSRELAMAEVFGVLLMALDMEHKCWPNTVPLHGKRFGRSPGR